MARFKITYSGKDITKDISGKLVSLTYIDRLEGRASSLEIEVEDHGKNFASGWYPQVGDKMQCLMGNNTGSMLDCGAFWVDTYECTMDRSGVAAKIKGLSVPAEVLNSPLVLKDFTGKNFVEAAGNIAKTWGMDLIIDKVLDVRLTENFQDKDGLALLFEIARKRGMIMKIENNVIFFEKYTELKKKKAIALNHADTTCVSIKDQSQGRYKKCTCKWWDTEKQALYTGSHENPEVAGGGESIIWEKVESDAAASERAKDWLEDREKFRMRIDVDLPGNIKMLSGVMTDISGIGKNSGRYIVYESRHTINRGGYNTSVTLRK